LRRTGVIFSPPATARELQTASMSNTSAVDGNSTDDGSACAPSTPEEDGPLHENRAFWASFCAVYSVAALVMVERACALRAARLFGPWCACLGPVVSAPLLP
jgi:hypothetical protein